MLDGWVSGWGGGGAVGIRQGRGLNNDTHLLLADLRKFGIESVCFCVQVSLSPHQSF